jgi:hypothetical protein
MHRISRLAALLAGLALMAGAASPASAVTYYLAVDVHSTLAGATFAPSQIVRSTNAAYATELNLPADTELLALHRRPDGVWLFTPAHPLILGGALYEPRDIVSFNGVGFAMALDGSAVGVPADTRIDALLQLPNGDAGLSFDVPVNLGGTEYSRSDLVRYNGAFSLFWDAEAPGVPASSNVVGAAFDAAGTQVLTFDVPTRIGATEFLPGQLVRWSGAGFASYFVDPAWPGASQLRDFAFVPTAGIVPDGFTSPGTLLAVTPAAAGQITLTWGASCVLSDTDYEIYEGTIGSYYSHAAKFCTTGGALTRTFAPAAGSRYYLVVPRNGVAEGSYGVNSAGASRPPGVGVCLAQSAGACN